MTNQPQPTPTPTRHGPLTPGHPHTIETSRRGVQAKQAKAQTLKTLPTNQLIEHTVRHLTTRILTGKIEIRHGQDAAAVLRVLLEAIRAEGQARDRGETLEQLRALVPRLEQAADRTAGPTVIIPAADCGTTGAAATHRPAGG